MINDIAIIGTGTMAKSIALLIAKNNKSVFIYSKNKENKLRFINEIDKILVKRILNNKILENEKNNIISRINICDNMTSLKNIDLVIETSYEDINIKKNIFLELDKICHDKTIFATNTSSLSIQAIADVTSRKDKFIGIHFFNPAEIMKLVELVTIETTTKDTIESVSKFLNLLDKEIVYIKNSRGFVVNRILIPMINEAIGIYYEGIASKEDIDKAMMFGANHPIGPLKLADLIGLDVCLKIMNSLYDEFLDSKYKPHKYLEQMVSENKLGKKTKCGFYDYN